ncbi:MAG TPA: FAD:protein FMN transferase [Pirellulales bacterium]|nr:FAD:protein FMN transferase [Pirellulales bacterium]
MLGSSILLATLAAGPLEAQTLARFSYRQNQMGAPVELLLYAADQRSANIAAEAVYSRFSQLNRVLSDYDPASELSRLSDTAGSGRKVPVSHDLWVVLAAAQELSGRSGGAFDITVGPYVKLWRRARREKEFPPAQRLAAAASSVGYQFLHLDPQEHTAQLSRPLMRLDLGGIAAGYACDEALKVLHEQGITRALIDASGDILAGDPPPGEAGWKIGIAPLESRDGPPSRYLLLARSAVTTSGDAWQFVELRGQRYSHIVDPHTGLGLTTRSSVTVVAGDCLTADSLATAACVLGPSKGLELIEQTPAAAGLIAVIADGKLHSYSSRRLDGYEWHDSPKNEVLESKQTQSLGKEGHEGR